MSNLVEDQRAYGWPVEIVKIRTERTFAFAPTQPPAEAPSTKPRGWRWRADGLALISAGSAPSRTTIIWFHPPTLVFELAMLQIIATIALIVWSFISRWRAA